MTLTINCSLKSIAILRRFKIGSHDVGRCDANAISPCSAIIDTGVTSIWMPFSHGIYLMMNLYISVSTIKIYTVEAAYYDHVGTRAFW